MRKPPPGGEVAWPAEPLLARVSWPEATAPEGGLRFTDPLGEEAWIPVAGDPAYADAQPGPVWVVSISTDHRWATVSPSIHFVDYWHSPNPVTFRLIGPNMVGRRLPVVDGKMTVPTEPGDYCGPVVGYTGDLPSVTFLKPNARDDDAPPAARSLQHVTSPPHTFTEEADGTLTIAASIGATRRGSDESDGYHGYLERGIWRKV